MSVARLRVVLVASAVPAGLVACAASTPPPPASPAPVVASSSAPPLASTSLGHKIAEEAPAFREDPERRKKLEALFPKIDALVAEQRKEQGAPAVCVALVEHGETVHAVCDGEADVDQHVAASPESLFRIASVTKTFTAAAILRLRDQGKLTLDEPAERLLPELAEVVYPTADAPRITARHLLQHTSGLPRDGADLGDAPTSAVVAKSLRGLPLEHAPGSVSQYSNLGFALLGELVARASGARYRDYVTRELLRPLGLGATWDEKDVPPARLARGYVSDGKKPVLRKETHLGETEANGGLYASPLDLARWAAFQLDAHPPRSTADDGPLSRASRREAHVGTLTDLVLRTETGPDVRPLDAVASFVGLAWHGYTTCDEDWVVWHSGLIDGYTGSVHTWPNAGVALVLQTNLRSFDRGKVSIPLRRWMAKAGVLLPRRAEPPPGLVRSHARVFEAAFVKPLADVAYEALFARSFRDAVSRDAFDKVSLTVRDKAGRCGGTPKLVSHEGLSAGVFETVCDNAVLETRLSIDAEGRASGFRVVTKLAPDEKQAAAAKAAATLLGRFDAALAKKVLAPSVDRAKLAAAFDAARKERGACTLGEARASANPRVHAFALTCAKGAPVELDVESDDEGRLVRADVRPLPAGRCPKE